MFCSAAGVEQFRLREPRAMTPPAASDARLMSLTNGSQKMSKSAEVSEVSEWLGG